MDKKNRDIVNLELMVCLFSFVTVIEYWMQEIGRGCLVGQSSSLKKKYLFFFQERLLLADSVPGPFSSFRPFRADYGPRPFSPFRPCSSHSDVTSMEFLA